MTTPNTLTASVQTATSARAHPGASAGVRPPAADADPAKLMKAAHDFEAMAIGELLQPIFESVDTAHGLFGGGTGEESWKPMLVTEIAKQIEAHGGLGLAQPVYQAMLRMQEDRASETTRK